jgi:hypothetical protein
MATPPTRTAQRATRAVPRTKTDATVDLTASKPSSEPLMPHDRDEKAGMTGGVSSKKVQQGARDVQRGLQDTSRAPEADEAYKKLRR